MNQITEPEISIIMPVFNTGRFLNDAVDSVLFQRPTVDCAVPAFELVLIDDASTDPETIAILQRLADADPRIVVLKNQCKKGAAGARNTGIMKAKAGWLGFIDSDDIWTPTSLALRWHHILKNAQAQWVAGRFRFLKPEIDARGQATFKNCEVLWRDFDLSHDPAVFRCLEKPIHEFAKNCFIGIISVLIRRDLILKKGMFNESLPRAEDYHLWFKCAYDNDLWLTEADVSFYRIHSASLTHGDAPLLLYEDKMLELLMESPEAAEHRDTYLWRFDLVMQDTCYFYRKRKLFKKAVRTAMQWIRKRPLKLSAWKELTASCMRAG